MSRASQNASSSVRKRTKPIVNLNAASRRRKDNADTAGGVVALSENKASLDSERKEGCSVRENVVQNVNSNSQDERTRETDWEKSNVPCKKESNAEEEVEVVCVSPMPTKSVSEKSHAKSGNESCEKLSLHEKNDVERVCEKLGSSDVTETVKSSDGSQPTSKKQLPRSIHRFSRRNFTPNVKRERHVNDENPKATSSNEAECHSEHSSPSVTSLIQEKEKSNYNNNTQKDVTDSSTNVECVNILDGNSEDDNPDLMKKPEKHAANRTDCGEHKSDNRQTGKDVDVLCDSGDESRFSISSTVSTLVRNDSYIDSDSCLEDGQSSVCEEDVKLIKPVKERKRKRHISDTSRRLSVAKREFESRYANKAPDRKSMRMFDLIYYNPATNPMKSEENQSKESIVSSLPPEIEPAAVVEENVDDPDEVEEEEVQVPAPRVKVGPDGEIVIDEQSLVIETTLSKKSRKEMANLTVVVDTGSSTTYNTYSKKKRHRSDWCAKDTIKFYKALQAIGTDFSLMQSLFPSRSRADLKTKFKKEEKINSHLVEKALRYPTVFDLTELEKELNAAEKADDQTEPIKKKRLTKGVQRDLGFNENDDSSAKKTVDHKPQKKKKIKTKKKPANPPKKGKNKKKKSSNESTDEVEEIPTTRKLRDRIPGQSYSEDNGIGLYTRSESEEENEEEQQPEEEQQQQKEEVLQEYEQGHEQEEGPQQTLLDSGSILPEPDENYEGNTVLDEDLEPIDVVSDDMSVIVPYDGEGQIVNQEEGFASNIVYEGQFPDAGNVSLDNVPPGSIVLFTTECPDKPGYHICNVFMVQDRAIVDSEVEIPETMNIILPSGQEEVFQAGIETTESS